MRMKGHKMRKNIKIILGTSNQGKIKEIEKIFADFNILSMSEEFEKLNIEENGSSFEENALIKAREFYNGLKNFSKDFIIISDDSGLCVDELDGEPGIYSARYAKIKLNLAQTSDLKNIECLWQNLKAKKLSTSSAKFICAIAIVGNINGKSIEFISKGECKGRVVDEIRGTNGFGYDPIFIPDGYNKTLAELSFREKNQISHRKKALIKIEGFLNNELS